MRNKRLHVAAILTTLLFIGLGFIVYNGRPVITNRARAITQSNPEEQPKSPSTANKEDTTTINMATVQSHHTKEDCFTAINGNVYDLSSWVYRHPGGASSIIALCGTDGSAAFNKKHGSSRSAQAMLALLKIGELQQ